MTRKSSNYMKELLSLVELAKDQGWKVKMNGHEGYQFFPPDKNIPPISTSKTPKDHRAAKNNLARLKRAGLKVNDGR